MQVLSQQHCSMHTWPPRCMNAESRMQNAECRMQNAESIKTSIIIQVEIVRALLVDSINFYDGIIDSQVNYNLVDFNIFYYR